MHRLLLLLAIGFVGGTLFARTAAAQSGAYLNGLGWYNLNTAKANSINLDTYIRWKGELRKRQYEYRLNATAEKEKLKGKVEEAKRKLALREIQLRTDPSA